MGCTFLLINDSGSSSEVPLCYLSLRCEKSIFHVNNYDVMHPMKLSNLFFPVSSVPRILTISIKSNKMNICVS